MELSGLYDFAGTQFLKAEVKIIQIEDHAFSVGVTAKAPRRCAPLFNP
jgi:hypothetical protein